MPYLNYERKQKLKISIVFLKYRRKGMICHYYKLNNFIFMKRISNFFFHFFFIQKSPKSTTKILYLSRSVLLWQPLESQVESYQNYFFILWSLKILFFCIKIIHKKSSTSLQLNKI